MVSTSKTDNIGVSPRPQGALTRRIAPPVFTPGKPGTPGSAIFPLGGGSLSSGLGSAYIQPAQHIQIAAGAQPQTLYQRRAHGYQPRNASARVADAQQERATQPGLVGYWRRFNLWLAVNLTKGVGSMACAYLFALLQSTVSIT